MQRKVEWRDLDSLEHVNNATYAEFAESAMIQALAAVGWSPSEFKNQDLAVVVRRIHIKYLAQARWGDTLAVATSLVKLNSFGGEWYIVIRRKPDDEQILRCVIEWGLVRRGSEEAQELPDGLLQALRPRVCLE